MIASRPVGGAHILRSEIGEHPLCEIEIEIDGARLAFFRPGVGAPLAAGLPEEAVVLGCHKFVACGGAGLLDSALAVGHVIVPASLVRDEGALCHSLLPAREVRSVVRTSSAKVARETWTAGQLYCT